MPARPGWQQRIEEQGLVFWRTDLPDGTTTSYWHEEHAYELTLAEALELERVTDELVELCIAAGDHVVERGLWDRLGIPARCAEAITASWYAEPPMLYGRFDLALPAGGPPKLLEFNADTPTSLLEAAVVQWHWLEDVAPEADQLNALHDRLVARWRELVPALPNGPLHLVYTSAEASGEDWMTVAYVAETARQAGLDARVLPIEELHLHRYRGFTDARGNNVRSVFKLYPWEWLVEEPFAEACLARLGDRLGETTWVEPIWKMLWSNKGLLAVLWELFPGHPNLLEAHFDDPRGMAHHVRKPLLSREGANVELVGPDGLHAATGGDYGAEGVVFQQWTSLGDFGGVHPVLGLWVVDQTCAGLGIRESDGPITDNLSRFVPHLIRG